jgi:uncharacterized protein
MEEVFQSIRDIVVKELECSAHNIDHIDRVYNLCLKLSESENVDLDVIKASALLHDIARVKEDMDSTGKTDHAVLGSNMAEEILKKLKFPNDKIQHVKECILTHRYRTGNIPQTLEAEILFDADKLDTIGTIGLARCFVWVGKNNAHIYRKVNLEDYIKENLNGKINGRIQDASKHSVNIEYETKLKFIVDKLHTEKAKEIGKERIDYFKSFLDRLEKEINGEI